MEDFNTPEYTLSGIEVTLRQGIASSNDEFKHQKLCEALDFFTRYKAALKQSPTICKDDAPNLTQENLYVRETEKMGEVDVLGLKHQNYGYWRDRYQQEKPAILWNNGHQQGWYDCIDHLLSQGIISGGK